MSVLGKDIPLSIVIKNDAVDGFKASALDADLSRTFPRSGAIVVEYDENEEEFQIDLMGDFRKVVGPILKQKPATIGLSRNGVFQIVQRCRTQWEEALAGTKIVEQRADGSPKDRYPFEESWDNPVDQQAFDVVAAKLAIAGSELFEALFERDHATSLDAVAQKLRNWASCGEDALTIQADKFHIPWRMLYTHPSDAGQLKANGSNFRPEGFWGYQHILEQFPETYALPDFRLVAKGGVLSLGAALNEKIDLEFKVACVSSYRDFVKHSGNRLSSAEWTDAKAVKLGLSTNPFPHQIVYFLCHAEGAGNEFSPNLNPWIEIAGTKMNAVDVRIAIKQRFGGEGPLVFLNACRGGQYETLTTHNFSFASEFINQGAKGFLGAQIEVPAVFAGSFGGLFFERLMSAGASSKFVGYVLRDVTRELWKRRNPLGLVYSLYAGADCHIIWDAKAEV